MIYILLSIFIVGCAMNSPIVPIQMNNIENDILINRTNNCIQECTNDCEFYVNEFKNEIIENGE